MGRPFCVSEDGEVQGVLGLDVPNPGPVFVGRTNRRSVRTFRGGGLAAAKKGCLLVPSTPDYLLPENHIVRQLVPLVESTVGEELRSRCLDFGGSTTIR